MLDKGQTFNKNRTEEAKILQQINQNVKGWWEGDQLSWKIGGHRVEYE